MLYCNTVTVAATRRAGRWALAGRALCVLACVRAWARGRALQAAGRASVGRSGRAGVRSGMAGRAGRAGVRSGTAGRAGRAGSWAAGARGKVWQALGRARQGTTGARAGCAGWPWAVHSVHSACFWPGLTQYFPESNFLDIVCEPGSSTLFISEFFGKKK